MKYEVTEVSMNKLSNMVGYDIFIRFVGKGRYRIMSALSLIFSNELTQYNTPPKYLSDLTLQISL